MEKVSTAIGIVAGIVAVADFIFKRIEDARKAAAAHKEEEKRQEEEKRRAEEARKVAAQGRKKRFSKRS